MSMVESVCRLLCGIGIFLLGMKVMGDGLTKGAGQRLRQILRRAGDKPWTGYGLGVLSTAVVQSSSATTVMSLGMVEIGAMTTAQACAFGLGARLGTSVTGILVSLSSIKITPFLMALALVGVGIMLLARREKSKALGMVLGGLGVLFAGMELIKSAVMDNGDVAAFFRRLFVDIDLPPLLVLVGCLFTALIQSSSATVGLLIALLSTGTLRLQQAMFLTVGATVGTCVSALLASIGTGVEAKRVAVFNALTAAVGAVVLGGILWPTSPYVAQGLQRLIPAVEWQLSVFGVAYSALASVLFVPLLRPISLLVGRMVRPSKDKRERCLYIDDRLLATPVLAQAAAYKELCRLVAMAVDTARRGLGALVGDQKPSKATQGDSTADVARALQAYWDRLSALAVSSPWTPDAGRASYATQLAARIAGYGNELAQMAVTMRERAVTFSPAARQGLRELNGVADDLCKAVCHVVFTGDIQAIDDVCQAQQHLAAVRLDLCDQHVSRLLAGQCTAEAGACFYTALSCASNLADSAADLADSCAGNEGAVYRMKTSVR